MNRINQLMNRRLNVICNQFIKERIGESELTLMPPKSKVPMINNFNYDAKQDIFEINFKECNDCNQKTKNGIDFFENQLGHLVAIRIRNFSKLDVKEIKLNVLSSIKNEIEHLSLELIQKRNILDNVIDKRKLMFLDNLVKHDYKELKSDLCNKVTL